MAWAMDTYMNTVGQLSKQAVKGVVTGKPVASGGTVGREKATDRVLFIASPNGPRSETSPSAVRR